ncbi:MAG: hypothetical protein J6Z23_01210 [Lachnospiraceae bacterium]|nr:hypothetical protein [Lachnospiraceae bacterium]
MNLTYGIKDRPGFFKTILFALQQLLAIMAATIAVPAIVGNGMSQTAALFGAGVGTLVYLIFTKFSSPVFLGSSFAFLGSMAAAFAGGVSMQLGYLGLLFGALFAALVYVALSILVKKVGTDWINKLMPAVVIGPTVAIIGLSLAGNAVGDLMSGNVTHVETVQQIVDGAITDTAVNVQNASVYLCFLCGIVTLAVTILCSVYGKKFLKMIPFIIGILAGYAVALGFTMIGNAANVPALQIINLDVFKDMKWGELATWLKVPDFTFLTAYQGFGEFSFGYLIKILVAYVPVAFVVFAEHIADHKNLSTIVGKDLLKDPGLDKTLLGDGVGSFAGAIFGGCPNTTYGESIGCVAISGNASVVTILCTAILAVLISFIGPFAAFLSTIPKCVMGGVCIALYGFIAVSGLKMIQNVDLNANRNLFVVSVILIAGVGGLTLTFGKVTLTEVALALILGILTNLMVGNAKDVKAVELDGAGAAAALPMGAEEAIEEKTVKAIPEFEEAAEDVEAAAEEAVDEIADTAEEAADDAADAVEDAAQDFEAAAEEAVDEIADAAEEAADDAADAVEDTVEGFEAAAEDAVEDVADVAEEAVEDVADAAEEAVDAAQDAVEETVEGFEAAAEEAVDDVADATEEAVDTAQDAVEETVECFEAAADEAVDDAADVAEEAAENAADAVDEAADAAKDLFF